MFAAKINLTILEISILVCANNFAGGLSQYPIGWLSDRMDRRHYNDIACGLFSTTLPLSGYSEYTVENMGTDYTQYDINDIFDIGDGGSDEIYPGASFRKGYSANTKNWSVAGSGNSAMKKEYTKHNNLYITLMQQLLDKLYNPTNHNNKPKVIIENIKNL